MKQYIRKIEKHSIFMSILLIILALGLIFKAAEFITFIIVTFGFILIGLGTFFLITYFKNGDEFQMVQVNLIEGIVAVCFGIFCILRSDVVQSIFPVVIGIWIIVQGMMKFQLAFNLKNIEEEQWAGFLITAILSLILGMIIICNPFETSIAITTIGGIMLLVTEILNLGESIWILKNIK